MRTNRPKNLNLFTIQFPIPAIVSILHRISGVLLFILIPILLYLLQLSLTYDGFETFRSFFSQFWAKFFLWVSLSALVYHLLAGVRHLLADMHIGTTLAGGRLSAQLTLFASIVLAILLGVWLW